MAGLTGYPLVAGIDEVDARRGGAPADLRRHPLAEAAGA